MHSNFPDAFLHTVLEVFLRVFFLFFKHLLSSTAEPHLDIMPFSPHSVAGHQTQLSYTTTFFS